LADLSRKGPSFGSGPSVSGFDIFSRGDISVRPEGNALRNGVRVALCLLLLAAPAIAAPPAKTATLTIHIENVLPKGGIVRLGLYNETLYPDDNATALAAADVPADPNGTVIIFHNLAPGTYAIQTFQDVNANDKMDQSWIGLPLEPFGFSRDATPFLSKPAFNDVKFTLAPGENIQVIHLQNSIRTTPADKARDAVRARQRQ
jgi:uncharacterized protein (DUF2141 family)